MLPMLQSLAWVNQELKPTKGKIPKYDLTISSLNNFALNLMESDNCAGRLVTFWERNNFHNVKVKKFSDKLFRFIYYMLIGNLFTLFSLVFRFQEMCGLVW